MFITLIGKWQVMRVLKKPLVTRFIDPFSYKNLSGQGTFSTPSVMHSTVAALLAVTSIAIPLFLIADVP
jgi:hypothetical protein